MLVICSFRSLMDYVISSWFISTASTSTLGARKGQWTAPVPPTPPATAPWDPLGKKLIHINFTEFSIEGFFSSKCQNLNKMFANTEFVSCTFNLNVRRPSLSVCVTVLNYAGQSCVANDAGNWVVQRGKFCGGLSPSGC